MNEMGSAGSWRLQRLRVDASEIVQNLDAIFLAELLCLALRLMRGRDDREYQEISGSNGNREGCAIAS